MWVISRIAILIAHIRGFAIPLAATHEPPSIDYRLGCWDLGRVY